MPFSSCLFVFHPVIMLWSLYCRSSMLLIIFYSSLGFFLFVFACTRHKVYMLCTVCNHPPSTFFCLPLFFSEHSQSLSTFCCPTLLFLYLFFSPPQLSFPHFSLSSICSFILVVFPDLLLLRPTCQDHRDQPHGNIFHPAALGTALNAHSAPVYSCCKNLCMCMSVYQCV